MSQDEILEFLYNERLMGNKDFFKVCDICKGLNKSPQDKAVRSQLRKLHLFGYIEVQNPPERGLFSKGYHWGKTFRLRYKHISTIKEMVNNAKALNDDNVNKTLTKV